MSYKRSFVYTLLIFLFLCGLHLRSHGQGVTKGVGVLSGGQVQFYFNSYNKVKEGIVYSGLTKLQVYFDDTIPAPTQPLGTRVVNPASLGWNLSCKALSGNIMSDDGVTTLPLSELVISPHSSSDYTVDGSFFLTDLMDGKVIVHSNPADLSFDRKFITIILGYSFASPGGLLDVKPGYFYIDLEFIVKEN